MDVIVRSKDAVVPEMQMLILLVEDVLFLVEEPVEMLKHEGGWWVMTGGEVTPSGVGLDSSIRIVVAKIRFGQVGICEG